MLVGCFRSSILCVYRFPVVLEVHRCGNPELGSQPESGEAEVGSDEGGHSKKWPFADFMVVGSRSNRDEFHITDVVEVD